jgi:hypothetical protein
MLIKSALLHLTSLFICTFCCSIAFANPLKIIEFDKTGVLNLGGAETLSRIDFTYKIADYFNLDK